MDPYYINEFLTKERLKGGLTQQEFADRLGITKQAVSGIEHFKNKVSYETVSKFCEEFNYKVYFQKLSKNKEPKEN